MIPAADRTTECNATLFHVQDFPQWRGMTPLTIGRKDVAVQRQEQIEDQFSCIFVPVVFVLLVVYFLFTRKNADVL